MSFYFTLKSGGDEFEIGRNMPGLWDAWGFLRTNPSENEVINREEGEPFEGWVVPIKSIIDLYTGLSVISALRPRNHVLLPEYDDCNMTADYWRLLSLSDFDEENSDPRFTVEALNADNEIRSKVYTAYSQYISKGYASTHVGDYNGDLSVYFWNFIDNMREFVKKAMLNSIDGIPMKFYN